MLELMPIVMWRHTLEKAIKGKSMWYLSYSTANIEKIYSIDFVGRMRKNIYLDADGKKIQKSL